MLNKLFAGKLDRKNYILRFVLSVVFLIVGFFLLTYVAQRDTIIKGGYMVTLFFLFLVIFLYQLSLDVRRLRDSGHSLYWSLLWIITPANFLLFLFLAFAPSKGK